MPESSGSSRGGRRAGRAVVEGEFAVGTDVGTALITGATFGIRAVQYTVVNGDCIVEGDISLGSEEEVARRNEELRAMSRGESATGVIRPGANFRWPNCVVPWEIDPNLPDQDRVHQAIAHWRANTGYTFVARTTHPDWIFFTPDTVCSSPVGRQGNRQLIKLAPGCGLGSVIHEIGHAVGLWHEQSREDRDSFVTINWNKIQQGKEHNFNQHIADGDDVGAYDYGSIMHYPRNAFSIDGSDTITPVDASAQIGQRTGLSAGDIAAVNQFCGVGPTITIKEVITDRPTFTIKEVITDRPVVTTIKEPIKDFREPIPTTKEFVEPIFPGGAGRPGLAQGGALPFAVAVPHQAVMADPAGGPRVSLADMAAQLAALAAAIEAGDHSQAELRAQHAHVAAALQQILEGLGGMA